MRTCLHCFGDAQFCRACDYTGCMGDEANTASTNDLSRNLAATPRPKSLLFAWEEWVEAMVPRSKH